MTLPWDMLAAELSDTMRGGKDSRPRRPCVYCGKLTRALNYVCTAHDDLPSREPAYVGSRHDQVEVLIRQAFMEAE